MLKEMDHSADEEKKSELKKEIKDLRAHLTSLQEKIKENKLPIIVLVEGWASAGKGTLINELISEIDPRFFRVLSTVFTPNSEARYPFLYPYAAAIPENGKFLFMDGGWMEDAVRKLLRREITEKQYKDRVREINEFERQLRDGGYLILKIFLHIDKKEQTRRMARLLDAPETEWRDLWQHREYDAFYDAYDRFMDKTDGAADWHVLDGSRRLQAVRDALKLLTDRIDRALEKGRYVGKPFEEDFPLLKMPKLRDVDLSPALEEEAYKKELKKLQKRLGELHNIIYRKKIPVVLCFEGWDAAGKGGNIRRLTYPLDPRGYDVIPIASPLPHELARQYLWRFWTKVPRSGHFAVFDRTWYGRVMVERLEGFCSEVDGRTTRSTSSSAASPAGARWC